ncbi:hypothetical protein COS52_05480 [Candidatus Roizmanbacteria bacterium CG03_land_8_20_14_0_80_39_12]|uniref:Uncharacterized protein n=2 Tax=Candidatus Roizmaniibacteriota TaxID=1752723 RepID=A0A2M7BQZ2_9BACT|nr:MAG: hypothetical protein COS52_05480 [Candidatus Roizmanbacteria bacterium CG03_land_8_20_14_0_80_39_12]
MKTSGFMHSINASETPKLIPISVVIGVCVLVVALGGVGGYMMVKKSYPSMNTTKGTAIQTDKAAGVMDKKTFKDSIIGLLKEGGVEGEGNFHLERPGGVSQNVYLTSTTVDLSKYIGKKVKVWGQTFQGQKAGWLMDVGLVEIQ